MQGVQLQAKSPFSEFSYKQINLQWDHPQKRTCAEFSYKQITLYQVEEFTL